MALCEKCKSELSEGATICTVCGMPQVTQQKPSGIGRITATADTTDNYSAKDIADNKIMAVLAYLGALWLIPFFAKKDSPFVQYHCKQGFTLLLADVIYLILSIILTAVIKTPHYIYGIYYGNYTPGWLSAILWIISLPLFILSVIGIITAASGKAKELPFFGRINIMR